MSSKPFQSGHAPVNGIRMYYEVRGRKDGVPLVLLHGGGSIIEVTFSKVLPVFAGSRRVLALEEQAHGRTTDRNAPVAFESSADDVAAFLRYLKVDMHDVQHISVSIARPPAEVYEFASDPRNLPRWAAGLARSEVRRGGDEWIADAPFGKVRVRFVQRNPFGVMDHDVTLESGVTVHNPMRVVPNGDGSELVFTLIRQPGMSDAQFAKDEAAVENDLKALKDLLERKSER